MATNEPPTVDLNGIIAGFVQDLRILGRPRSERGDEKPTQGTTQLRTVTEQVRGSGAKATLDVNAVYRERTEAMHTVVAERQRRLEAYATRQRQAVPTAPDRFIVAGRVTDRATGAGLPHVRVRATDLDRREDDVLGYVRTDALGYYRLEYTAADFAEADQNPETFIEVLDDANAVIFTSSKSFIQKAGQSAFIPAVVDGEKLPDNLRMASKVTQGVDERKDHFAQRQRVLDHRADVVLPAAPVRGPVVTLPSRGGAGGIATGTGGAAPAREPVVVAQPAVVGRADLGTVKGIGPAFRERLEKEGVTETAAVARMKPARLAEILNVGESRAKTIIADAKVVVKQGAKGKRSKE